MGNLIGIQLLQNHTSILVCKQPIPKRGDQDGCRSATTWLWKRSASRH